MYSEDKKEKPKNRKMMKIGQLVSRQLNPKIADEMARNAEDTELVMENARIDREKERKKQRNRGQETAE